MKHTPGPWRNTLPVHRMMDGAIAISTPGTVDDKTGREKVIALVYSGPEDAQLMAAAPEMRKALEALCAWGDEREEKLYPEVYKPWAAARALLMRIDKGEV